MTSYAKVSLGLVVIAVILFSFFGITSALMEPNTGANIGGAVAAYIGMWLVGFSVVIFVVGTAWRYLRRKQQIGGNRQQQ